MGKIIDFIPQNVMDSLIEYHWPGNVRELENVLERAMINSSGPKLCLADELRKSVNKVYEKLRKMEVVEREHILKVLEETNWKISGKDSASEILGLDRSTLRARINKLNIVQT
jgi:chemotaxis protein methyltransferase CheR